MCDAQLVYGFCLHQEDQYRKVLTSKQLDAVRQELEDLCTCTSECDCDKEFAIFLANYELVKAYDQVIPGVEVIAIDGENTAQCGIDGDCAVIGVCVNSGEGHHTGILEIPKVKPEHAASLDAFVAKFPQFAVERSIFVVYNKSS
jgi:hypothetical protein